MKKKIFFFCSGRSFKSDFILSLLGLYIVRIPQRGFARIPPSGRSQNSCRQGKQVDRHTGQKIIKLHNTISH